MKSTTIIIAIIIASITNFSQAQPQNTNFWKGGTPGQTTNWNCPENWSLGKVPDPFQNVIIPDVSTGSGVYPIIKTGGLEVHDLVLEAGAILEIQKQGSLKVEGYFEGFGNFSLITDGTLVLPTEIFAGIGEGVLLVGK